MHKINLKFKKSTPILFSLFLLFTLLMFVFQNATLMTSSPVTVNIDSTFNLVATPLLIPITASSGRYEISIVTDVTDLKRDQLKKLEKNKYNSILASFKNNGIDLGEYYIYQAWDVDKNSSSVKLGIFDFKEGINDIVITVPAGVSVLKIKYRPYISPAIPTSAQSYNPILRPPSTHPRLWVSSDNSARTNLTDEDHLQIWKNLQIKAEMKAVAIKYDAPITKEMLTSYGDMENQILLQAFIYLMDPSKNNSCKNLEKTGAYDLLSLHLKGVKYNNLLDVTRNIGHTIYTTSLVHDWCFSELTNSEKKELFNGAKILLEKMEFGWPPFRDPIVIGHGNEYQLNRDVISFAISFYEFEAETKAYQFASYRIFEELIPMRKFQYQSPRHSQGYGYGNFRFGIELGLGLIYKKMLGVEIFDPNIKKVFDSFFYLQVPPYATAKPYLSFYHLDDGDGEGITPSDLTNTALNAYSYAKNSSYKNEFINMIKSKNPKEDFIAGLKSSTISRQMFYLLLDDPNISPVNLDLPNIKDSGPVLGSMISRTGRDNSEGSGDVIIEAKGGGYCFNNHQHSDSGSFQIFYKEFLAGNIGTYGFAGTDYDVKFNRRSISKSLMRFIDPNALSATRIPMDGGVRCGGGPSASNIKELLENLTPTTPTNFSNGSITSSYKSNSLDSSYFALDLTNAYASNTPKYTREFIYFNLHSPNLKAFFLVYDQISNSTKKLAKIWQLNTIQQNVSLKNPSTFEIVNASKDAKLNVQLLLPASPGIEIKGLVSGEEFSRSAHTIEYNGGTFSPPVDKLLGPHAKGSRITATNVSSNSNSFLAAMQIGSNSISSTNLTLTENGNYLKTQISDNIIILKKTQELSNQTVIIDVPADKREYRVLVTGIISGKWGLYKKTRSSVAPLFFNVEDKVNAVEFRASPGRYILSQSVCTVSATNCSRMRIEDGKEYLDFMETSHLSAKNCKARTLSWYNSCSKLTPGQLRTVKLKYKNLQTNQEESSISGHGCIVTPNTCNRMKFAPNESKNDILSTKNLSYSQCMARRAAWTSSCSLRDTTLTIEQKANFILNLDFFQNGSKISN